MLPTRRRSEVAQILDTVGSSFLRPTFHAISAYLQEHQMHWHSSVQELWGLLCVVREARKQLGRIAHIVHTDHANLARIECLALNRLEPKILRWYQEIVEGGSLLMHRPGASTLHRGPDGISRNPEGRDRLLMAKDSEWDGFRQRIRGIIEAVVSGAADDDEPQALTIEHLERTNPGALEALPKDKGLAVSMRYERGSRNAIAQHTARGAKPPGAAASSSSDVKPKGKARAKAKAKVKERAPASAVTGEPETTVAFAIGGPGDTVSQRPPGLVESGTDQYAAVTGRPEGW